ncbi:hypothetical protein LQ567_22845 [Niabella pedocola]|uniref:Uncharacterized protein n=1 Tax=Niabella pedocola TaxID=1752077 RepID=A0ABS8PX40_9BACT|nr:hypothetical protein [Niabella pedocola]MCD2425640.1 hypothetical protein [Niabella pedocola]
MKPEKYIELLNNYFYSFPVDIEGSGEAAAAGEDRFNAEQKMYLLLQSEHWKNFYNLLARIQGIRKIREFQPTRHSIKILCALENSMINGIGMYLSLLGDFYGLYYITESSTEHVEYFGKEFGADLSYVPLTDQQKKISTLIEELIAKHFPAFQKFDNKWADYPVQMPMDLNFEEKSTLFKVFFEKDPGGIFF